MKALNKIISKHESLSHAEFKALLRFIAISFAYAWWAVIIVYYGILDGSIDASYQFASLPIVVVSLSLVQVLRLTLSNNKVLLSSLSILGLFVSGLLA